MNITFTPKELADFIKELQSQPDDLKDYALNFARSLKRAIRDTQTERLSKEQ